MIINIKQCHTPEVIQEWWSLLYLHFICHSGPREIEWILDNDYRLLQAQPNSSPVTATGLDVIAPLEQINKASGAWDIIIDITNILFSVPIRNKNKKTCIHMEQIKFLYNFASGTVNNLALCHNIVQRDWDCQLVIIISVMAPKPTATAKLWLHPPTPTLSPCSGREAHRNLEEAAS